MANTLNAPKRIFKKFKRVAILFAGGPAPAANAVISAAAASFLRSDMEVVGIRYGYTNLVNYDPASPLIEGEHFVQISHKYLARSRNTQGILIGTSRTNPGKYIANVSDLDDPEKVIPLHNVYQALRSIGVEALISIGGDDTLKTANKLKLYQEKHVKGDQRIRIVHLPKTIDNDYHGIDFTFGYFTAVEFLGTEIRNLIHDAESCQAYFIVELMGRSAGWLAYGAAIAGEASLVISVEDITDSYRTTETFTAESGEEKERTVMDIDRLVRRIVKTMLAREAEGKQFGVVALAEGLAAMLPWRLIENVSRDDHGHIAIGQMKLADMFATLVDREYTKQTGRKRSVKATQLGYESRCAKPHAFDVMLGSQLGVGAYRALAEEQKDGVMVSVVGQLELHYEPFESLVDPETLVTKVRLIEPNSDFHRLARFLETDVND
ncbi:MAG TPA: 6-phosphofructokinase [Pirellulaceae bacterium]|nr:6-phosphofructokinase [Pirellulaceae bacterium]HMO93889.1 6-phosphofructokinase [Pirellulaceae bacterium]HMP70890.1 6-phosphofructokinase [Pirellulaceae bacterium]